MHDTAPLRWQAYRDSALQSIGTNQFEQAEQAYLAALDHSIFVALDTPHMLIVLHDLIELYDQHSASLGERQRGLSLRIASERDAIRQLAQARARLYRRQLGCYQRVLYLNEQTLGPSHRDLVNTLLAMADIHWVQFNEFDSFPLMLRALAIRDLALGPDHPDSLDLVRRLALRYSALTSFTDAAPFWRRILAHLDLAFDAGSVVDVEKLRETLCHLGKAYNALANHVEAEKIWRRYAALPLPKFQTAMLRDVTYHINLSDFAYVPQLEGLYGVGRACLGQGKWHEAEPLLREAVKLHEQHPHHVIYEIGGAHCLGLDAGLHDYAKVLQRLGCSEESLPLFEQALAKNQQQSLRFADLLRDYALALRDTYQIEQAIVLEKRAGTIESEVAARRARLQSRRFSSPPQ